MTLENKEEKITKLHRMEIEPSENKGLTITHIMPMKPASKSGAFMEREPEKKFTFGPEQHQEALQHMQTHLGMKTEEPAEHEEEEEGGEEE